MIKTISRISITTEGRTTILTTTATHGVLSKTAIIPDSEAANHLEPTIIKISETEDRITTISLADRSITTTTVKAIITTEIIRIMTLFEINKITSPVTTGSL